MAVASRVVEQVGTPTRQEKEARSNALLRETYDLVKDLMTPNGAIYWGDLALTGLLGYGGFLVAATATNTWVAVAAWVVSVLALYRGVSFIHELTHLRSGAVPGFFWGWNLVIGIPLLVPSFMYDGVHQLHHAKTRYGTAEDPEYLPLAWRSPVYLVWFLAHSVLAPVAVLVRFGILTPLSLLFPAVRTFSVERASSLLINPAFRRKMPRPQDEPTWWTLELLCFAWAWTFVGLVVAGIIPGRVALLALATAAAVAFTNQLRTLAAHLWDNEHGEEMTIEEQLLDSVNVPGPSLASLWAPVGLRYHALHHLLPGLPYHNLGPAHRRLAGVIPNASSYRRTWYDGLLEVLGNLFRKSSERTQAARKRRAVV